MRLILKRRVEGASPSKISQIVSWTIVGVSGVTSHTAMVAVLLRRRRSILERFLVFWRRWWVPSWIKLAAG
jgi:hypothetical protein